MKILLTFLTTLFLAASGFALDVSISKEARDNAFTVDVEDAQGVAAYQFELVYNENVITEPVCTTDGTIAESMTVICNAGEPGHLLVAAFGTDELYGSGSVLHVAFTPGSGASKIIFNDPYFFSLTGVIEANYSNGYIEAAEPCVWGIICLSGK